MNSASKSSSAGRKRRRNTTLIARAYPYPIDLRVEESVPRMLELSNYVEWEKQMLGIITRNGLGGFVDGTVKCPPKSQMMMTENNCPNGGRTNSVERENEDYMAWMESDALVQNWIKSRLTYSFKTKVDALPLQTATEVWEALTKLVEDKKQRLNYYLPLYKAAIQGDWKKAEEFFIGKERGAVLRARITLDSETALIVAVRAVRRRDFVTKLVDLMSPADLAIHDDIGRTALHRAAGSGNFDVAKLLVEADKQKRKQLLEGDDKQKRKELLVEENSDLPNLETYFGHTPLYYAAARGDRQMILWLMEVMKNKRLDGEPGFNVLYQLTINQLYDIALEVLKNNPTLAIFIPEKKEDLKYHALTALADTPSSFESGNNYVFLQGFIYSSLKLENIPDPSRPHAEAPDPAINNDGAVNGMKLEIIQDRSRLDVEAPDPASNNVGATDGKGLMSPSNNVGAANGGWGCAVKKRLRAMLWKVVKIFEPLIKPIREKKMRHDQALALLQLLCEEVAKSDFSKANRIFQLPLQQATSVGIPEIVEKILGLYPCAISLKNQQKQSIFEQAIVFRQEKVFNLIHQLEESKEIFLSKQDVHNNNALHLAGYVADPQVAYLRAGSAFQMQRELQWFKEVEGLVVSKNKEQRNRFGKTPAQVFSDTHKELLKEGERWMKDTASSCTFIASLIATVVFTAAIQVPGGNDNDGHPIFHQQIAFIFFGISDGLALFSSIASLLMFLSILTSSYAQEDFLFALPNRMIIGLISLFVSILFMMVAFGATLYLVFGENKGWIRFPVVVLVCLSVILFVVLQSPLLVKMCKSTYGSSIFVKRSDRPMLL